MDMFSRSHPAAEGEPQDESQDRPYAEAAGDEASRAFDQVLTDLNPPGAPDVEADAASVAASVDDHATTLRATREAHREAQSLLALAGEKREQASEAAELILAEAREAAERTRQELAGWAAAQRAKVGALAAELSESARRDADAVRAEALRTSMLEAEETSRVYLSEATSGAERDAEEIRAEARGVLQRASELGEEIVTAITDLVTLTSDVVERLHRGRTAMEQLLSENPEPVHPGEADGVDPDDDGQGLADNDAPSAGQRGSGSQSESEPDAGARSFGDDPEVDDTDPGAAEPEVDGAGVDGAGVDGAGAAEPGVDDPGSGSGQRTAESGDTAASTDRQLGSMFRRQGHHGRANDQ